MAEFSWDQMLDAAAAEGFSGELPPEGTYTATAEVTNHGTTQNGKMQVGIMYRIEENNLTVWDNMIVTPDNPKAMKVWFSKWNALGVKADEFRTLPEGAAAMAVLADRVKGTRAVIKVTHREWNGEKKANVFPQKLAEGVAPVAPAQGVAAPAPAANPFLASA